jgi:hypothetical protein
MMSIAQQHAGGANTQLTYASTTALLGAGTQARQARCTSPVPIQSNLPLGAVSIYLHQGEPFNVLLLTCKGLAALQKGTGLCAQLQYDLPTSCAHDAHTPSKA